MSPGAALPCAECRLWKMAESISWRLDPLHHQLGADDLGKTQNGIEERSASSVDSFRSSCGARCVSYHTLVAARRQIPTSGSRSSWAALDGNSQSSPRD